MAAPALDPIGVKWGPRTSEFWQTVFVNILALVVAGGTLLNHHFDVTGIQALIPALSVIAAAIVSAVYGNARSSLKAAATQANATVLTQANGPVPSSGIPPAAAPNAPLFQDQ